MHNIPEDLEYDRGHIWVRKEGDKARIGISDFLQRRLGKIGSIQLPAAGQKLAAGMRFGLAQGESGSQELIAPASAEIVEVNRALGANPALCNEDPYGEGWLAVLELNGPLDGLLNAEGYEIYCQTDMG